MPENKIFTEASAPRRRWRSYRPRRRPAIGPLGLVAPLINVTLLFIMFLIMKSGVVLRPGINLQLPQSEFTDGAAYDTMVLIVTQEGLIFFNDDRILLEELAFALSRAAHRHNQTSLTIEADLRVQYGMIVRIVNMATIAGIRRINLATRPAFGEGVAP